MAQRLTTQNFSQSVSKGVCFVKLSSPFCKPCTNYQTAFNAFAAEHPNVKCFDVDASREIGISNDFKIKTVPVTLVLLDGKEVARRNGVLTVQTLEALIPQ